MMNYESFKKEVGEKFLHFLPERYQDMDVEIHPVEKVNGVKDSLHLMGKGGGEKVSPAIYVEELYEQYRETGNLPEVLQKAAETMEQAFQRMPPVPKLHEDSVKDNIVFQLVNTVQNEDMLRGMPHREFHDLSVIYRWVAGEDKHGIVSAAIQNPLAESLGMEEEQLYRAAMENTKRIFPPVVKPMEVFLQEVFDRDGMPDQMADAVTEEIPPERMMWIISNDRGLNGAGTMLYEECLQELAERVGNDLYILPSSVHEVIAVSAEWGEPEELAQLVVEVNMTQVELEERLSNQVYHYDKDLKKLSMATNTPNKRLDRIAVDTLNKRLDGMAADTPDKRFDGMAGKRLDGVAAAQPRLCQSGRSR